MAVTAGRTAASALEQAATTTAAAAGGVASIVATCVDGDLFLDLFFDPSAFLYSPHFLLGGVGTDLDSLRLLGFDVLADLNVHLFDAVFVGANVYHHLLGFSAIGGHGNLASTGLVLVDAAAYGDGHLAGFTDGLITGAAAAVATRLDTTASCAFLHAGFSDRTGHTHSIGAGFHLGFGDAGINRTFFLLHNRNADIAVAGFSHPGRSADLVLTHFILVNRHLNSDFNLLVDPLGDTAGDFDFLPFHSRCSIGYYCVAASGVTTTVTALLTTHGPCRGAGHAQSYEGDDCHEQTLHQMTPQ